MRLNSKPVRYGAAFTGALLLAWEKLWWLIGWWADVDFVSQKAGGVNHVVSVMASATFGNVANLVGIALMIVAFLMVERREPSSIEPSSIEPSSIKNGSPEVPQPRASTPPPDEPQPLAATRFSLSEGLLPVKPEQIFALFEGHTALQAQSLIAPYRRKRIAVSGIVATVGVSGLILLKAKMQDPVITIRVSKNQDYLPMLHEGSTISVVGTIEDVSKVSLDLVDCEIIEFGAPKPK